MKSSIIFIALLGLVQYSYQATRCDVPGESSDVTTIDQFSSVSRNERCYTALANQVKAELGASIKYLQMSAYFSSESHFRPGLAKFYLESAGEERGHAKKIIDYYLMRGGQVDRIKIGTLPATEETAYVSGSQISMTKSLKDALALEDQVTKNIRAIVEACEKKEETVFCTAGPDCKGGKAEVLCNPRCENGKVCPSGSTECNDNEKVPCTPECKNTCYDSEGCVDGKKDAECAGNADCKVEVYCTSSCNNGVYQLEEDYHAIDFLTGEFLTEQHEGMRKIVEMIKTRATMSSAFGTLADVMFDQSLHE